MFNILNWFKPKKKEKLIKNKVKDLNYTEKEIYDHFQCNNSCSFFANNFIYVHSINGEKERFNLYEYQIKLLHRFSNNRFNIVKAPRQSGKTLMSLIYALWYATFHENVSIIIGTLNLETSISLIKRIKEIEKCLPDHLRIGCETTYDTTHLKFKNGSTIRVLHTKNIVEHSRGRACQLLILDEFAYFDVQSDLINSVFPMLMGTKTSKLIMLSTPKNKNNKFYEYWEDSILGINVFVPTEIYWQDNPWWDQAWKYKKISEIGKDAFKIEYEGYFLDN